MPWECEPGWMTQRPQNQAWGRPPACARRWPAPPGGTGAPLRRGPAASAGRRPVSAAAPPPPRPALPAAAARTARAWAARTSSARHRHSLRRGFWICRTTFLLTKIQRTTRPHYPCLQQHRLRLGRRCPPQQPRQPALAQPEHPLRSTGIPSQNSYLFFWKGRMHLLLNARQGSPYWVSADHKRTASLSAAAQLLHLLRLPAAGLQQACTCRARAVSSGDVLHKDPVLEGSGPISNVSRIGSQMQSWSGARRVWPGGKSVSPSSCHQGSNYLWLCLFRLDCHSHSSPLCDQRHELSQLLPVLCLAHHRLELVHLSHHSPPIPCMRPAPWEIRSSSMPRLAACLAP